MALGLVQSLTEIRVPGIFLGVKSGRRIGLTTLPPSMSRISENVGASTSHSPKGLHGLYRENVKVFSIKWFPAMRLSNPMKWVLNSVVQTLQCKEDTALFSRVGPCLFSKGKINIAFSSFSSACNIVYSSAG
jgi:hypothetical protein